MKNCLEIKPGVWVDEIPKCCLDNVETLYANYVHTKCPEHGNEYLERRFYERIYDFEKLAKKRR